MRRKLSKVVTSLYLPPELMDEIRRIAVQEDRSFTAQITRFIQVGLEQYRDVHSESNVRRLV